MKDRKKVNEQKRLVAQNNLRIQHRYWPRIQARTKQLVLTVEKITDQRGRTIVSGPVVKNWEFAGIGASHSVDVSDRRPAVQMGDQVSVYIP